MPVPLDTNYSWRGPAFEIGTMNIGGQKFHFYVSPSESAKGSVLAPETVLAWSARLSNIGTSANMRLESLKSSLTLMCGQAEHKFEATIPYLVAAMENFDLHGQPTPVKEGEAKLLRLGWYELTRCRSAAERFKIAEMLSQHKSRKEAKEQETKAMVTDGGLALIKQDSASLHRRPQPMPNPTAYLNLQPISTYSLLCRSRSLCLPRGVCVCLCLCI
jgi:hypothetical protein